MANVGACGHVAELTLLEFEACKAYLERQVQDGSELVAFVWDGCKGWHFQVWVWVVFDLVPWH